MMSRYPGNLIDDEKGFRVLKCYIYKFIRHRIVRRPRFDIEKKCFTTKEYFWFYTLRPMSGSYHSDNNIEKLEGLWHEQFIIDEPYVYFLPQYTEEKISKKRKSYIFLCTGIEAARYLASMTLDDLQNITIFSSRFNWAIDLLEDTVLGHKHDMDVLVYVKRP